MQCLGSTCFHSVVPDPRLLVSPPVFPPVVPADVPAVARGSGPAGVGAQS